MRGGSLSSSAVIGGVVGAFALVFGVVAAFLLRWRRQHKAEARERRLRAAGYYSASLMFSPCPEGPSEAVLELVLGDRRDTIPCGGHGKPTSLGDSFGSAALGWDGGGGNADRYPRWCKSCRRRAAGRPPRRAGPSGCECGMGWSERTRRTPQRRERVGSVATATMLGREAWWHWGTASGYRRTSKYKRCRHRRRWRGCSWGQSSRIRSLM